MSNIPTISAIATIYSVFTTFSRFTVPVVVRSAKSSIMNPAKERNPPRAILSRCLSGKYDIALSQPIISIAQDNIFVLQMLQFTIGKFAIIFYLSDAVMLSNPPKTSMMLMKIKKTAISVETPEATP